MTVTVSGLNYTQIAAGETVSGDTGVGGTWSGDTPVPDPGSFLEGSNSMSFVIKSSSGIRYATFTPTASIDLSGTKHVRFWFLSILGSYILAKASGGIMFYCTDGTNTGYWNLDGSDTYNGGWKNMVVDVSRAVDSGTKPTNMNAITALGVAMQLGTNGKNVASTWIDNLNVGDGLICYGDDGGGYFDFEDIYLADSATTGGWGIITKTGGAYFLTGAIQFGDSASTNSCKFQAKSQTVIFEDRGSDISSTLMGFDVVDNGTGTTEFILGDKSGTAGISGCNIRVADTTQIAKFYLDAATDTDVDNFKLYGTTFLDASTIEFPVNAAAVEILNCAFESCGIVTPSTAKVENSNFVSPNNVGVTISSTSHGVASCTFISCLNAVQFTVASTSYALAGCTFIGGDGSTYFDVENTSNATTTDSYSESNQDTDQTIGNGTINRGAQSFTGDGNVLSRARIWLKKSGTLTGTIVAKVYLATGTAPNAYPTGAALATSNTIPATDIGATYAAHDFEFEDEFTLVNTTEYFISVEYAGDASNYLIWGTDTSSPPAGSNFATYTTSWSAVSTADGCFYIYTGGIVKIALSGGSNPSYDNNSGTPPGATIMPISNRLTLTDLVATSEVRILDTNDNILDGIESCGTTFEYDYVYEPATTIRIVVAHNSYKFIRFSYVLTDSDVPLPIQQVIDVNYSNP